MLTLELGKCTSGKDTDCDCKCPTGDKQPKCEDSQCKGNDDNICTVGSDCPCTPKPKCPEEESETLDCSECGGGDGGDDQKCLGVRKLSDIALELLTN